MEHAKEQNTTWEDRKKQAASWFRTLQNEICTEFESIEDELSEGPHINQSAGRFKRKPWERENSGKPNESGSILNGGGEISLMHGRVFEKVGVNVSEVWGTFSEEFAEKIPGAKESDGHSYCWGGG